MGALCLKAGVHSMVATPIAALGNGEFNEKASVSAAQPKNLPWGFTFRHPLRSLWSVGKSRCEPAIASDDAVLAEEKEDIKEREERNGNWVFKILHVKALWKEEVKDGDSREEVAVESEKDGGEECGPCGVDYDDDDEKIELDRESFCKLLRKVPLAEARLYAKMCYLGSLAYAIPHIKPKNLFRHYGLRFVTSSLEKKEQALKVEKEKESSGEGQKGEKAEADTQDVKGSAKGGGVIHISASAAYQIAASAASYLHSHTTSILRFNSSKSTMNEKSPEELEGGSDGIDKINDDMASMIATDTMATVVAAKEEVKQAVADDLNSVKFSPCEWFVCDDDQSATRFFVIQGSESLSSWQANLFFEPIQFEGLDFLVHRGIYEAAKGIYEQMLPEIRAHLKTHGDRATFRFTGHSLGGSLSLLINLMSLIRGEAPLSSLLPVITFGAPSIMCGGDRLLRSLGLPRNHVQSIALHRDIVPRAFSCNYSTIAEFLKAVNGKFRSLPCLKKQKLLYAPMGDFLILQPDNRFSPNHDLLPSGTGLYLLTSSEPLIAEAEKRIRAAQTLFLNSPHPLETLSDRSAYGSGGTIQRDHDVNSYFRSVIYVIRLEVNRIRKAKRERRRKVWWPLVVPTGVAAGIIVGRHKMIGQGQVNFSGMVRTGKESLKRFSRLVASQHMHLLLVFLVPAKLLILGTWSLVKF